MNIRKETQQDYASVRKINQSAFKQNDEADLVDNLRNNSEYISDLLLIAEEGGEVIGYILFTPLDIVKGDSHYKSLALAPMAVLPEHQNKGIGTSLIEAGFEKAKQLGFTSVVVLGHKDYYPRFGFVPAEDFDIHPPIQEWKESFFVKEITKGSLDNIY
jgi:putative acetyltransferase